MRNGRPHGLFLRPINYQTCAVCFSVDIWFCSVMFSNPKVATKEILIRIMVGSIFYDCLAPN